LVVRRTIYARNFTEQHVMVNPSGKQGIDPQPQKITANGTIIVNP
jgi:hypothetical protein